MCYKHYEIQTATLRTPKDHRNDLGFAAGARGREAADPMTGNGEGREEGREERKEGKRGYMGEWRQEKCG